MNKVMLIGNVGAAPDVRYYEMDQAVATLKLATNEKGYVLPNGTQVPDRTDWHTLVFYRRLAKVVERYVHKGDKLYVEGRLQYNIKYDKRGVERISAEVIVDTLEMLTPRSATRDVARDNVTVEDTSTCRELSRSEDVKSSSKADEDVLPF